MLQSALLVPPLMVEKGITAPNPKDNTCCTESISRYSASVLILSNVMAPTLSSETEWMNFIKDYEDENTTSCRLGKGNIGHLKRRFCIPHQDGIDSVKEYLICQFFKSRWYKSSNIRIQTKSSLGRTLQYDVQEFLPLVWRYQFYVVGRTHHENTCYQ